MPRAPVLLANPTGNQWINRTSAAGLNIPVSCVSGVAADFDNDMDMDIYLVCRNAVSNAPDILYENTGGGVFVAVSGAGGAPGPLGTGVGTGDSVVTADFDADGFVDLFQTNGLALFPIHPFSTGGPDKLYRNAGISNGSNHWIELDFAGTTSNRDGIGAIVTVTAGGVAQRKERNGGIHRWSQNHQRLHFGLASNTTANIEVTVAERCSRHLSQRFCRSPLPGFRGWRHRRGGDRWRAPAVTLRPAHLQQGDGASVVHLEELRHRRLGLSG